MGQLVDAARKDFFSRSTFSDQGDDDVFAGDRANHPVELSHCVRLQDRLKNYVKLAFRGGHGRIDSAMRRFGQRAHP